MANPFYIPQGPSVSERVLPLFNQSNEIDIARDRTRLMGEDVLLRGRANELKSQELQQEERKLPASRQNFDANKAKVLGMALSRIDPKGVLKEFNKEFELFANTPDADMGTVYGNYLNNWDETRDRIVNSFREFASDTTQPAAFRTHYAKLADTISKDKTGKTLDMFFPNVAREYQLEDEANKAKVATQLAPRVVSPGGALVDSAGQVLYQAPKMETEEFIQIPTTEGIYKLNKKNGTFTLMTGSEGKPLMSPSADIGLAGGKEAITKQADELVKERKDVVGAVTSLDNIKQAKGLLDSGIITGTGAQWLTNMGSFLSSRLGFTALEDPVMNTQAFAATMGNQVGQIIKQFGSGTGLSDADREYAEKIVGGRITLNEGAIRKLIDINEKAFTNVIKRYNEKADQAVNKLGKDSFLYDPRVNYDFGGKSALPDGLSEEDLQYNMNKYGKSRQEVIDQFNKRKGAK